MATFEVSDYVLNTEPNFRDTSNKSYIELIDWLIQNVGDKIPRNVIGNIENGSPGWSLTGTLTEGHGWRVECVTTTEYDDDVDDCGIQVMRWLLTIDDDIISTIFALKWT